MSENKYLEKIAGFKESVGKYAKNLSGATVRDMNKHRAARDALYSQKGEMHNAYRTFQGSGLFHSESMKKKFMEGTGKINEKLKNIPDHSLEDVEKATKTRDLTRVATGAGIAGVSGLAVYASNKSKNNKMEKSALALTTANYVGGALGLLGSRLGTEHGSKSNGEIAGALAGGAIAPAAYEAGEKLTKRVISHVGQKSPASISKIVKNMNKAGPIGAKAGLAVGSLGAGYLAGKAYNHIAKK